MGEILARSKPTGAAPYGVGALKVIVVLCMGALAPVAGQASNQFELMASEDKSAASGLASTPMMPTDGKSVRFRRGATL